MKHTKFCCQNFPSKQHDGFIGFYSERDKIELINYFPRKRSYTIIFSEYLGFHMKYCFWCGTKLPKELSDEWLDVLEKEYGLDDACPSEHDDPRIPSEFWTDEWWKKRGL